MEPPLASAAALSWRAPSGPPSARSSGVSARGPDPVACVQGAMGSKCGSAVLKRGRANMDTAGPLRWIGAGQQRGHRGQGAVGFGVVSASVYWPLPWPEDFRRGFVRVTRRTLSGFPGVDVPDAGAAVGEAPGAEPVNGADGPDGDVIEQYAPFRAFRASRLRVGVSCERGARAGQVVASVAMGAAVLRAADGVFGAAGEGDHLQAANVEQLVVPEAPCPLPWVLGIIVGMRGLGEQHRSFRSSGGAPEQ